MPKVVGDGAECDVDVDIDVVVVVVVWSRDLFNSKLLVGPGVAGIALAVGRSKPPIRLPRFVEPLIVVSARPLLLHVRSGAHARPRRRRIPYAIAAA